MTVDPKELRRGIYRIKRPSGMEDDAQVQDIGGGSEILLPESDYRARGYAPPFDELPWQGEYSAM